MKDDSLEKALENAKLTPSEAFWVKIEKILPPEEDTREVTDDPEQLNKRFTL